MYFGVSYYPEHWPEDRWVLDFRLMKEAHVNVVRMAEFAWVKMEPEQGRFEFGWLDRAVELAHRHGIAVILGTPTAGPPKWLMDRHPDIYPRDIYGRVRGFGTRRHYCFNSAEFHRHTERIVTKMAERYGGDRRIVAWQIDNEMGMIDTARCYCDNCLVAFRRWLRRKYGTIGALNEAWGTIFSSQTFAHWEEVHLPTYAVHQGHNPGLQLDCRRFASDSVRTYQRLQADILRKYAGDRIITTNQMGKYNHTNYYELSEDLDNCSFGIYPNLKKNREERAVNTAAEHDMTRGYKGQNYWVLEHQSGTPGATVLGSTPKPGELRKWTLQSVAHGADAIVYFRWRTLTYSVEEFWHGILQHHGEPGRKYFETRQVGAELNKLSPLLRGTVPKARAAIIRCYDNEWAFEIQPQMPDYSYIDHLMLYYRSLFERGITVDFVKPEADLTGYALVIAPNLMMASGEAADNLKSWVRQGGCLVMDYRAGAKLKDNRMSQLKLPGVFRDLLGIEIGDYGIIEPDAPSGMRLMEDGGRMAARRWYDVVEADGAETVAEFAADYYAGSPAVTRNAYGAGSAWYIAAEPDPAGMRRLMHLICRDLDLRPALPRLPAGVEAVSRFGSGDGRELLFVINHNDHKVDLVLPEAFINALTDTPAGGELGLSPHDVLVLRRP